MSEPRCCNLESANRPVRLTTTERVSPAAGEVEQESPAEAQPPPQSGTLLGASMSSCFILLIYRQAGHLRQAPRGPVRTVEEDLYYSRTARSRRGKLFRYLKNT